MLNVAGLLVTSARGAPTGFMHLQLVMPIAGLTFATTLIGGAAALRLRDRLHLILGFSAGAVIAVAFFDLLPESLALGHASHDAATLVSITAVGFFAYMILDRLTLFHTHLDDEHARSSIQRGWAGAASLSAHSFMDGFAIGVAFQASTTAGYVVALAVLAHDFSDGLNTVNLVLKNGGTRRQAFSWLTVDAIMPVSRAPQIPDYAHDLDGRRRSLFDHSAGRLSLSTSAYDPPPIRPEQGHA